MKTGNYKVKNMEDGAEYEFRQQYIKVRSELD